MAAAAAQAASPGTSQRTVAARSRIGSTAHSGTITKQHVASPSHQPMPSGPTVMPVASTARAATSGPSGTAPAQAATVKKTASQPQARNRPLKSSRRCRRMNRTEPATAAAVRRQSSASQTCTGVVPRESKAPDTTLSVRLKRPSAAGRSGRPTSGPLMDTAMAPAIGRRMTTAASVSPPRPVGSRVANAGCAAGSAASS